MSAERPALSVRDVSAAYGDHVALSAVSLEIGRGQVVALLGPNGAGKSTLASTIGGLMKPTSGTVDVFGESVLHRRGRRVRETLGWAAQDVALYTPLSIDQNLRFFGELYGMERRALAARIDELTTALDLDGMRDREIRHLSGGEQRRVHVAAALVHEPGLVILDEPTAGVDVVTRARVLELVRSTANRGAAVLYATHYLAEVENLADVVVILHHGQIVIQGTLDEVLRLSGSDDLEDAFVTLCGETPSAEENDR